MERKRELIGKSADSNKTKRGRAESVELASLADRMAKFESFVGEEYLTTLHLKIVSLIADELKINLGDLKSILEWIIEDEKRHEKIVTMIKDIIPKRNTKIDKIKESSRL